MNLNFRLFSETAGQLMTRKKKKVQITDDRHEAAYKHRNNLTEYFIASTSFGIILKQS